MYPPPPVQPYGMIPPAGFVPPGPSPYAMTYPTGIYIYIYIYTCNRSKIWQFRK